jgi:hypothetical protein
MQYLVNEVHPKGLSEFGEGKVFNTISDVVVYLQKINQDKRLLVSEREVSSAMLEEFLKERHTTVSVFAERVKEKKWIIAAF